MNEFLQIVHDQRFYAEQKYLNGYDDHKRDLIRDVQDNCCDEGPEIHGALCISVIIKSRDNDVPNTDQVIKHHAD